MSHDDGSTSPREGAAFPWILEHLLAYPGTYEIPLRTMYTLNSTTQSQPNHSPPLPQGVVGNAFPRPQPVPDEQQNLSTATAAAQLRANLMSHISQLPSQPCSLPPSFVTSFVRKCFPPELDQVDFPQALTALDYLKDLEVRRRREVVAALDRLGVERHDLGQKELLGKKYPGVLRWVIEIEEKERKVEALYTQVYLGLRRWTLINELSLTPFNKANCIAMLNTLYPPTTISSSQFVQPTAQLTPQILSTQRTGFFRYITAVEKNGTSVLQSLMGQQRRPGDDSGWASLRETLDKYLRMANGVIDECFEITGRESINSPTAASFSSVEREDEGRRKVDSGVSFTSSSNRSSSHSHQTRPSTSSSKSVHSQNPSKERPVAENSRPASNTIPAKPAGSTLERIAKEIKRIRSRGNIRDAAKPRPTAAVPGGDVEMSDAGNISQPPSPVKERRLRLKPSLQKLRLGSALTESNANTTRTSVRSRDGDVGASTQPAFDVQEMKRRRMIWEAQQKKGKHSSADSMNTK